MAIYKVAGKPIKPEVLFQKLKIIYSGAIGFTSPNLPFGGTTSLP